MMEVQFVEIEGKKVALLPKDDFDRLVEMAEDQLDIKAAEEAEKRRLAGEEYVPMEMADRIMDGESALRVWRQYRNMTLEELAKQAGIGKSYLSSLENETRQGKPSIWQRLAAALAVTVDDILPIIDANDQ